MQRVWSSLALAAISLVAAANAADAQAPVAVADSTANPYAAADQIFADYVLDAHLPGLVYGIVADGQLVHVGTFGVQDIESKQPVTRETLFRIASMTKAFTALTVLKLRDEGRLRLDAPAAEYVPEMQAWTYPTDDTPPVRVRDLLNHVSGFVTDDPWGDRQTPMPEADFTQLLRAGIAFNTAPGTRFEYSNLGYALLGRVVTNVSKQNYADTVTRTLLQPLGMSSSGFDVLKSPQERRAIGYRWEDNTWKPEPTLGPGVFGAMGGLQTSADDYAKWVAYLLSAWPPRDGPDTGPVRRSTVREMAEGSNFPSLRKRNGKSGASPCRLPSTYGMGMNAAIDCDLGLLLSHSGGYPGYGSHVLLLPDRGVGIFAFANRTYAGPSAPVWDAAYALDKAGLLGQERKLPVSNELARAYRTLGAMYASGSLTVGEDQLGMNFLLDRDADHWASKLAELKANVGDCDISTPVVPTGALSGDFTWRCAHGRLGGSFLLTPTRPPQVQEWKIDQLSP